MRQRKVREPESLHPHVKPVLPFRAFENLQDKPCPVCLELAAEGSIQARAVMPLPAFPARRRSDGRVCCRDCQATDTSQSLLIGQNPVFAAARLTVANERCQGLSMPLGLMELFGLCAMGLIAPCSVLDLPQHLAWLKKHGIPTIAIAEEFELGGDSADSDEDD